MRVKFLSTVQHDAKLYAEGDTADLPAEAAKPLVDSGAAEAVADKPAAGKQNAG